jgi:hypothetical protein
MDSQFFILALIAALLAGALIVIDIHRRHEITGVAVIVFVLWTGILAIAGYVIWKAPVHMTSRLENVAAGVDKDQAASAKDKFDVERDLLKAVGDTRSALIQIIAASVVLGGLYFTYRTLTGTARISVLQRYGDAVGLLQKASDLEKLAGIHILVAIERLPEGEDLHVHELLRQVANDVQNHGTKAVQAANDYLKSQRN